MPRWFTSPACRRPPHAGIQGSSVRRALAHQRAARVVADAAQHRRAPMHDEPMTEWAPQRGQRLSSLSRVAPGRQTPGRSPAITCTPPVFHQHDLAVVVTGTVGGEPPVRPVLAACMMTMRPAASGLQHLPLLQQRAGAPRPAPGLRLCGGLCESAGWPGRRSAHGGAHGVAQLRKAKPRGDVGAALMLSRTSKSPEMSATRATLVSVMPRASLFQQLQQVLDARLTRSGQRVM